MSASTRRGADLAERTWCRPVLSGRVPSPTPQHRTHPGFPLRAFVRCESCGRGLTGSWSKGRRDYYAYYHCRGRCRAVNITKTKLEELFVDTRLQPTPGFMRLVKDRVVSAWREMQGDAKPRIAEIERQQKGIREKLDRLEDAFLYERTRDIDTKTGTATNCARRSRSPRWTETPRSLRSST